MHIKVVHMVILEDQSRRWDLVVTIFMYVVLRCIQDQIIYRERKSDVPM